MSHLGKLNKLLEWLQSLLGNGPLQGTFLTLRLPEEKDFMTFLSSVNHSQKMEIASLIYDKRSAIVEFLQLDKETIWKGKYLQCERSFHTIKSFLISVLELILNERVSYNFWNSVKDNLSTKLLLPTETDYAGSLSNSLNGSFKAMESKSWFSILNWDPNNPNLQRTLCQSSMFSIVESKEKESTKKKVRNRPNKKKKDPANYSRKYRIYTNQESKTTLKKWFGCVRKTYNWALGSIKDKKYPINREWLRNRLVNASNIPKELTYLKETPKHVREGAIDDLVDAYKINFNKGDQFEIKFRSKKESQSIVIPRVAIKSLKDNILTMYPTMLHGTLRMYSRQPIEFNYDCRMSMDKLGRFYLHVPLHRSATPCDNQAGIVALDPGVRTFLTAYGLKDDVTIIKKIGHNDIGRIYRLALHLDKLLSKQSKIMKKSLKRAEMRLRNRIKNLVKEVHWKAASWLCKTFKHIIIPPFTVSNMVNRKVRKIGKKTVRSMLHWSHFAFRQRLIHKASQYDCEVHVLGEEYTTKVCTQCGYYNPKIKCEKVLKCRCCKLRIDRDVSGARNIFIKNTKLAS